MTESKKSSRPSWIDPDDAPDLSTPAWIEKFKSAKVSRGRPIAIKKKVLQTLRLDPEVIEFFKGKNPKNWMTRVNDTLVKIARGEVELKPKSKRKQKQAA